MKCHRTRLSGARQSGMLDWQNGMNFPCLPPPHPQRDCASFRVARTLPISTDGTATCKECDPAVF